MNSDYLACSTSGQANTGSARCNFDFKQLRKVVLAQKDFKFADKVALGDISVWQQGIADRMLIPLPDIKSTEDLSTEAVTEDENGIYSVVKDGEYRLNFQLKMNQSLYHEIKKLEDRVSSVYNVFMIDSAGNVFSEDASDGGYKGVSINVLQVIKPPIFNDGTTTTKYNVIITMDGEYISARMGDTIGYIAGLGISPSDIEGIMTVAGVDQTSTVTSQASVFVKGNADGLYVTGLEIANFSSVDTISSVVERSSPELGIYDVTFDTATGTSEISIVPTGEDLYASNSFEVTIGA